MSATELLAGYYGDDVTGSVDVLLQFARRGLRGCLFIGIPAAEELRAAADGYDVVGIAGIARSLAPEPLDDEVRPALEALRALAPRVVQYKACSTADSSPQTGSLGRVIEIARDVFGEAPVPLLFAQPDFGRYTVFGHHFAAESGVVHRLDRQPTMSRHPSTPMDDSDLVAHLSRQTALPLTGLAWTEYSSAGAVAVALRDEAAAAVVLDALDDAHLRLLGEALLARSRDQYPLFVLGSGGLSRALALASPASPLAGSAAADGPVLAVSGSRSPQTRYQIEAAQAAGWAVLPLASDEPTLAQATALLRAGRSVALTSENAPVVADASDPLAVIAREATAVIGAVLCAGATDRVLICGGDTSSRVVRALGVSRLSIAANPESNVVVLRAGSTTASVDGIEMLLKGGQVGDEHLFETFRVGRPAAGG